MHHNVTYEPAPARALDTSSSGVEFLLEGVEGAPAFEDSIPERAVTKYTTIAPVLGRRWRKVPPEE